MHKANSPPRTFPSLPNERQRAAEIFGIDIEASFNAWMTDMLGEGGPERLRRHLGLTPRVFAEGDLSEREKEVLSLIACGYSRQEVADILFVSIETVKSHMRRIHSKLGVQTAAQAVSMATLVGELKPEVLQEHLFRDLPGFAAPRTPIAA